MKRAAVLALIAACADPPAPPPAPGPAPAAAPEPAPIERGWVGVTTSAESVDVAPAFDGVIATLTVRVGDRVLAGATLATLDARPLREDLAVVRAEVREAEAFVRRGLVEVERARYQRTTAEAGHAAGTESAAAVEEGRLAERAAEAAVAEARASLAQVRALLDRAAARVADTAVVAPFAGTVGLRYVDAGAAVGPRAPVLRLIGAGRPRLRFAIPVPAAARIAPGVEVVATIDGWPPLPATVASVAPAIDQASQMIFVDAELGEPTIPPGLAAGVRCRSATCRGTPDGP